MANLEDILSKPPSFIERHRTGIKNYAVDSLAGFTYFQTLNTINELGLVGMDTEQWLKTRAAGALIGLGTDRLYGKFRNWYAEKVGTTEKSSKTRKLLTDTSAMLLTVYPAYLLSLYLLGVNHQDIQEAIPGSFGLTIFAARTYGYYQDKVRAHFETQRAMD